MEPVTTTVPVKTCRNVQERKRFDILVPTQNVTRTPKYGEQDYTVNLCNKKTVKRKSCQRVTTGVDCANQPIRRSVRLTKQICDRKTMGRKCIELPFSNCENQPGQVCKMVPRQVCQDTCSTQNKCNTCSEFVGSGGFGTCNTGTCNNYIPRDAVTGNTLPDFTSMPTMSTN